jgi:hypothetical protein
VTHSASNRRRKSFLIREATEVELLAQATAACRARPAAAARHAAPLAYWRTEVERALANGVRATANARRELALTILAIERGQGGAP